MLIFEEKWTSYATGPNRIQTKSTPNSDSFLVRWVLNVSVRIFCAPNATVLLVYIPAKIKMSFIWKNNVFAKIGIFCKSITGPLSSVVQVYTQPYSFGGRIKLIICQITLELSVTIHEISTSWKKTLHGGPNIRPTNHTITIFTSPPQYISEHTIQRLFSNHGEFYGDLIKETE